MPSHPEKDEICLSVFSFNRLLHIHLSNLLMHDTAAEALTIQVQELDNIVVCHQHRRAHQCHDDRQWLVHRLYTAGKAQDREHSFEVQHVTSKVDERLTMKLILCIALVNDLFRTMWRPSPWFQKNDGDDLRMVWSKDGVVDHVELGRWIKQPNYCYLFTVNGHN